MPLVLTFLSASTPRLPLASALRFFSFAAAEPPPLEASREADEEARPGRYVEERTEEVEIAERWASRAGNLRGGKTWINRASVMAFRKVGTNA